MLDPVDDALRIDAGGLIGETHRFGDRDVEPLAAEVRHSELVELVVEPGRVTTLTCPTPCVRSAAAAAAQLATAGTSKRCERRSTRATSFRWPMT